MTKTERVNAIWKLLMTMRDPRIPNRPNLWPSESARCFQGGCEMEDSKTWYGPHACDVCGATIVKASIQDGGAAFDPPERLMRIYQRGAECSDPDVVYPMVWAPHVHVAEGNRPPRSV